MLVEFTDKKGGKVVGTERSTVSSDGKTLGVEFTGYPEDKERGTTTTWVAMKQ